jgi:hypothetical protein
MRRSITWFLLDHLSFRRGRPRVHLSLDNFVRAEGETAVNSNDLSRREFAKLTAAALGGVVAGATVSRIGSAAERQILDESPLTSGKNVCRGLNPKCGGHKGGSNQCAGRGSCHTANKHTCHGSNDCKGEGGCGKQPGENACKGEGECGVPLGEAAWKRARANFETAMKGAGKKFGPAPSK